MSDFAPGDVVVCVRDGVVICPHNRRHRGERIRLGATYKVAATYLPIGERTGTTCGCISIVMMCGASGLTARFRKIRPASESFTRQVRACRPIKTKELA